MIGSLRGTLRRPARHRRGDRRGRRCGLSGVGADIGPGRARSGWGVAVFLHVHTHVREDAIVLYGFAHADERRCFEALLGAHGVGPSLALAILSALSPAALSTAVLEDDLDTLCLVPGRGQEDSGPAAPRAQGPTRPPVARRRVVDRRPAARPGVRPGRRWPSWATDPRRSAARSSRSTMTPRSRSWCGPPCASWCATGDARRPQGGAGRP